MSNSINKLKNFETKVRRQCADHLSTPSLFRLLSRREANQARAIAYEAARAVVG
jgi:hypothetical protein